MELDDQEAVKEAQKLDRNEINGRYIEGLYKIDEMSFLSGKDISCIHLEIIKKI